MKKIIMNDIAKKANVSLTTVSYILNNVKGQTISADTRYRVQKIAQELGYIPNLTARSLASKKSGLIGVMVVKDDSGMGLWKDYLYSRFINEVERLLAQNGYHILVTSVDVSNPEFDVIFQRELEGVFLLDINSEAFYKISTKFNVPIIIVDGYLDDAYFHKIVPDFEGAIAEARRLLNNEQSFLIADRVNNYEIKKRIQDASHIPEKDIIFVSTEDELTDFAKRHQDHKGIIVNEFVGLLATRYIRPQNTAVVCTSGYSSFLPPETKKVSFDQRKSAIAVDLMMSYVNGDFPDGENKYSFIKVM